MTGLLDRLNEALTGRYSVESEIGRGGMATVFLAEDIRHRRKVAIKVLHPELASAVGAERFLNEVETVAGLNHPHILPLHDSGEADGLLYYVMPYIEGESLRERLETQGQLPIEEAVRIAVEVADGLDYAHGKGVVHRDVKPGNILLSGKHAVIADFGIARAITVARDDRLTGTGLALGTPLYASPEQATGAETLDGRTDIYSLGCVLYEMLSGEIPLGGPTPQAMQQRRMSETPSPLHPIRGTVSPLVDQVIAKALATLPADRFDTAEQFGQALMVATMDATPVASLDLAATPALAALARAPRRAPRWLLMLVPAVALGALGAWAIAQWQAGMTRGGDGPVELPSASRVETQLTDSGDIWPFATPVLSPDGRYLAYVESDDPIGEAVEQNAGVNLRLMVAGIGEGGALSEPRLIAPLRQCLDLSWSPDGRQLLVSGTVRGTTGLFLVPVAGGRIMHLSSSAPRRTSWSPDATRLAVKSGGGIGFVDVGPDGPQDVADRFALPAEYGQVRDVAWSPRGDRIAVLADSAGGVALSTVSPDGSDWMPFAPVDYVGQVGWSQDGEAVYYSHLQAGRGLVRINTENGRSAAGEPEIVVPDCRWFSLSDAGDRLACTRISRPSRLWLVPHGSPGDSVLLSGPDSAYIGDMVLSPDGTRVLYVQEVREGVDLFAANLADGGIRRLTFRGDAGGRAHAVAWSPDARWIAYLAEAPDGTMAPWFIRSDGGPSVRAVGVEAGLLLAWAPGADPMVQAQNEKEWITLEPPVHPWDSALAGRSTISDLSLRSLASTDSFYMQGAQVSPDGEKVAVFWQKGPRLEDGVWPNMGTWIIDRADSSETLVRRSDRAEPTLLARKWSADGESIFLMNPARTRMWRLSLETGELTVPDLPDGKCHPEPLDDGRFLCRESQMSVHAWLIEDFETHARP